MPWREILIAVAVLVMVKIGQAVHAKLFPSEHLSKEALPGKKLAPDNSLYLVDIRTPSEWKDTGVIKGAHLATFSTVANLLSEVRPKLEAGQKLAVICRSGNRSSRAARKIAKAVNYEVVDIEGGMSRVVGEGYRTVKPTRAMGCESC